MPDTPATPEVPPLPEPISRDDVGADKYYYPAKYVETRDAMWAEKLAALRAAPPAALTEDERRELLDWVSACQSAYHIESTPGHRFGGLSGALAENRDALCEYVEELLQSRAALAAAAPQPAAPESPKPLDDPRLQQLFTWAIDGALTSGYQGVAQPPAGHWLEYWWQKGCTVSLRETTGEEERQKLLANQAQPAAPVVQAMPDDVRELLSAVPIPPRAITYERGWELLDRLQAIAVRHAAPPTAAPSMPAKEM